MKQLIEKLSIEAKRNLVNAVMSGEVTQGELNDPLLERFIEFIISGQVPIFAVFGSEEKEERFFPHGVYYGGVEVNENEFSQISKLFHVLHPEYKNLRGGIVADFGVNQSGSETIQQENNNLTTK